MPWAVDVRFNARRRSLPKDGNLRARIGSAFSSGSRLNEQFRLFHQACFCSYSRSKR